jgi:hypothetical protein
MASLERRIQKLFSLVDYAGVESRVLVELGVDAGKLCEDWEALYGEVLGVRERSEGDGEGI